MTGLPASPPPAPHPADDRWPASAAADAQVFVADLDAPALADDDAHHLVRVLRLRDGAPVVAADGSGGWRSCRLVVPGRGAGPSGPSPALRPDGPVLAVPEPAVPVTVAFVPVKGDRPEWVVQKLTEVGVDRVVVLHSERSVVRWDRSPEQADRALSRLRRVAEAAAAQSRRPRLPVVEGIDDLAGLAAAAEGRLALAERGGAPPDLGHPVVAVGPEGGWTDAERAAGADATLGLGPGVLRAETAAVAAGVLLCALRGG